MESCEGCLIKCTHYAAYTAELISKAVIIKCPCSICLIKMVCNKGCDEFNAYIEVGIDRIRDLGKATSIFIKEHK
jgi:hypothetical protein